jgi:outer membrane protein
MTRRSSCLLMSAPQPVPALVVRALVLATAIPAVLTALTVRAAQAAESTTDAPARILTLAEAERAAVERQPQLLVARAQTASATAQAEQTGAPLLPQVNASAQYQRSTGNFAPRPGAFPSAPATGTNGTGAGAQVPNTVSWNPSWDYWNFGVNASQLLYDFGQTYDRYKAYSATADSARATERSTRLTVVANVRRAYFNARAQKDLVKVAQETLSDQDKHLVQVQAYVAVGTQPEVALAQQKAAVASARVALITAQNNYETSKAQLNQAAGIVGGTGYDVGDEEIGPIEDEDQPLDVLASKAIAARPELLALQKQRVAARESLSSARGAYGPTLSATGAVTESGIALDGLVPNWNVGLLMNWPIFQGGVTRATVRLAQANVQTADAQAALEELQVRLDVDTARLAVRAAKATIGAADDALTSARQQLTLAEQRYAQAVGNIIELYDAQVAYTSAAAQVVQARYGLSAARAQLLAALGRT